MMDTFFFVEVELGDRTIAYGPYLNFGNAAEIMMDCLPTLLAVDHPESTTQKLAPSIKEYCLTETAWELVNVKVKEQRD